MRSPVSLRLRFVPALVVAGSLIAGNAPPTPVSGPEADYPVVVGEPFTIGSTTYRPEDTLNYDAVGYASVGQGTATRYAAAHKTLPLPSYAEVTNLDSGRTILVRVETRGPMRTDRVIELSQAAAQQLGIGSGGTAPVRVRRVVPPEPERAVLRSGEAASLRIESPEGLLKVLRRKLAMQDAPAATASEAARPIDTARPTIASVDPDAALEPATAPAIAPKAAPAPPAPASAPAPDPATAPRDTDKPAPAGKGSYYVQVAAFSTQERADAAAKALDARIEKPGRYWLMRLGPFESRAQAGPALEKARNAGYRDATIQRSE